MKNINSIMINFFLRANRADANGNAPIFVRISLGGKRCELSTGRKCNVTKWSNEHCTQRNKEAEVLNNYLSSLNLRILEIYNQLMVSKEVISLQKIKDIFSGKTTNTTTLIELFKEHNEKAWKLVDKEFSRSTCIKYGTVLNQVTEFMKLTYNIKDIQLRELKYTFITDYEFYLKTVKNVSHNTAAKYIKNFRKIVHLAVKTGIIDKDPFASYNYKYKVIERGFLTKEELYSLESKKIPNSRLDAVRDMFLFACYTGLSYKDAEKLSKEHIIKGVDDEMWIHIKRTKTGGKSQIPLLPKAQQLLDKYNKPNSLTLLPILSNQKMNAYFKEIAIICDIEKNLTFHLARHTFATTVTLTNGVSIESVSAMLGHKSIRTTQIYSKVVEEKISKEMNGIKNIF